MAGMKDTACHPKRLELTEYLMLGRPLPDRLSEHLATCRRCADHADEVREVVRTLKQAGPAAALGSVGAVAASRDGTRAAHGTQAAHREYPGSPIVGPVRPAPVLHRRGTLGHRRTLIGAAAMAVVLACAGIFTALADGHRAPAQTTQVSVAVHLTRTGRMVQQPWGTEIPVALSNMKPGQVYLFLTEGADGELVQAGSARIMTGTSMRTEMVSAMRRDTIVALVVEDQHGHPVAKISVLG